MKLEELDGLEYPFEVRITHGHGWYIDKEGNTFEIYNVEFHGDINANILHPSINKRMSILEGRIPPRSDYSFIRLEHCELVKEPTYQNIKEVYNNLSKETLDRMVFEKMESEQVEQLIENYGIVWGIVTEGVLNGLEGKSGFYFTSNKIWHINGLTDLRLYGDNRLIPVTSIGFNDINLFVNKGKLLNPEHPTNKKILEELLDNTNTTENVPQIHYTKEIELI